MRRRLLRRNGRRVSLWLPLVGLFATSTFVVVSANVGFTAAQSSSQDSQSQDASALPSFEVVSINPDNSGWGGMNGTPGLALHISLTNIPLKGLITRAFGMNDFQISGGPAWINTKRYDIEADVDESLFEQLHRLPKDEQILQLEMMEQSLLAERFKLKVTHTNKQLRAYNLVLVKDTSKLKPFAVDPFPGTPMGIVQTAISGDGRITIELIKANLGQLTAGLTTALATPVMDKSGVSNNYSLKLRWTDGAQVSAGAAPNPDFDRSLTAALQDLSLKLEPTMVARDTITIDHIEEPTPN